MNKKVLLTVLAVVVLGAVLAGIVYAALRGKSNVAENDLTAAPDPSITVAETWDEVVKEDVKVDVGTPGYSVYVRAKVVFTWKDKDGNVYSKLPVEGADYTVDYNVYSGSTAPSARDIWFKGSDGFFYYTSPVISGTTNVLINECKLADNVTVPDGYQLSVEVISQTVQYKGTTDGDDKPAVVDAWGVTLSDAVVTSADDSVGVYIITGPVSPLSGTGSEFEVGQGDLG